MEKIHEKLKEKIRQILSTYGFLTKTECWIKGYTKRIDICGHCYKTSVCNRLTIAVEINIGGSIENDIVKLTDSEYSINIILSKKIPPGKYETKNKTLYIINEVSELETILSIILNIHRKETLATYKESTEKIVAENPYQKFSKELEDYNIAHLEEELLTTLLWGYYIGALTTQTLVQRIHQEKPITILQYVDKNIYNVLLTLKYIGYDTDKKLTHGKLTEKGRTYRAPILSRGEILGNYLESRYFQENIDVVNKIISRNPIKTIALFTLTNILVPNATYILSSRFSIRELKSPAITVIPILKSIYVSIIDQKQKEIDAFIEGELNNTLAQLAKTKLVIIKRNLINYTPVIIGISPRLLQYALNKAIEKAPTEFIYLTTKYAIIKELEIIQNTQLTYLQLIKKLQGVPEQFIINILKELQNKQIITLNYIKELTKPFILVINIGALEIAREETKQQLIKNLIKIR